MRRQTEIEAEALPTVIIELRAQTGRVEPRKDRSHSVERCSRLRIVCGPCRVRLFAGFLDGSIGVGDELPQVEAESGRRVTGRCSSAAESGTEVSAISKAAHAQLMPGLALVQQLKRSRSRGRATQLS